MYPPPAFREDDTHILHALMQEAGLCTLVTHTAQGLMATPLPVWLEAGEGAMGTIYAHVARGNPQGHAVATGEGLVIFHGPDAYVSPSWYPAKAEHHKVVPTWNYIAVHAYGPVETFDDADQLRTLVTRLTQRHEAGRAEPWAVSDAPDAYRVIGGAGEMCADLAQWANGKPSAVRPVAWTRVADLKPSLRAEIRHLSLDDGVTADAVYVVKGQGRRDLVFVKAKLSGYDYSDNLVFAAIGGRQTCFVNGAIYGNPHCQDALHEQLPYECDGCDDSYEWQANWRMKTELLTWRGGVYAADIIANGPYMVLWKSPDGFYAGGDGYQEVAHCVLKR